MNRFQGRKVIKEAISKSSNWKTVIQLKNSGHLGRESGGNDEQSQRVWRILFYKQTNETMLLD